jgi:hypothetical protein
MKLGSQPDDRADYWEQRKNIEYKMGSLTNAVKQLGQVDGEMKQNENKLNQLLEAAKQPD